MKSVYKLARLRSAFIVSAFIAATATAMLLLPSVELSAESNPSAPHRAGVAQESERRHQRGLQKRSSNIYRSDSFIRQSPDAPLAPSITATLADSFTDADGDNKAEPGQTVNYTVVINNGGPDPATGVTYSEPIDPITTLVAGSVHASPLAVNETYNWVGNTVLDTNARSLPSVTANDLAINPPGGTDTFTITGPAGGTTTLGGTVALNTSTGHFVYTPPVGRPNAADGASVNDSFTYTLTNSADSSLTSTGTVTIPLTGRVWYLQAGAAGDGRSGTPSGNPAAMSTAADKSTDIFYVFSSASTLNGAFTLDNGQQLLGQGVALVVNTITLFPAGTFPAIGNSAGNGVTLAAGASSTISGLNIAACSASAIASTAPNFGTLTVSQVSVNNTTGPALNLTSGALAATFTSLSSTAGANAVSLTTCTGTLTNQAGGLSGSSGAVVNVSGGSVSMTHSGSVAQANNAPLMSISGGHTGTLTFQTGTVSATNGTGLQFNNADGTYNFNGTTTLNGGDAGVDILADSGGTFSFPSTAIGNTTSPSGIAFNVDGLTLTSTVNVTYSGSITQANNAAMVNVRNHNTGTITFQTGTLSATNGTGLQFENADSTTSYNFNGTTTLNGGDAGIDIFSGSAGTFSFSSNTSINNPSGIAFRQDASTANVTYNGTITKNNNANNAVFINGKTSGTNNFTGTITASTSTANAINLTSNTGGTINFTNTLNLTTTSGIAFNATGGGTVNVTKIDGTVAGIRLANGGTGYTSVPTVALTGGGGSGATATAVGPGSVKSINITNTGSSYTSVPTMTLTGGGGSGASALALMGVSTVSLNTGGSGFNLGAVATFTGGGGGGATARVQVTGGVVTAIFVETVGSGYTSFPTITITPASGGGGSGATASVTSLLVSGGSITNGGSGYTSAPIVGFTGGAGSGASATSTLETSIIRVNVTNAGSGYTSAPTIGFSGGGGSGATASALLTGSSNLTTTTGTALNVANTTIGSNRLIFHSISTNGATRGILLNATGSVGGLTVTGDSTTNGGTCTGSNTSGCSGGTIQNATGGDDSSTTPIGTGIVLNDTDSVVLTRMFIHDVSNYGIRGTSVIGFTLDSCTFNGTNGSNSGGAFQDSSVSFDNLTGSAQISNTHIQGGWANNFRVVNSSGSLDRITFQSVTIGTNNVPNGNDGILVESLNSAVDLKATIRNSTFTAAAGDLVNFSHNGTGVGDLVITNSSFSNNHGTIATGGGGLSLFSNATAGNTTMNITGNTFRDAIGPGILIVKSDTGGATVSATIANNSIGVAAVRNSGSAEGSTLKLQTVGGGALNVSVTGNQIFQYNNFGVEVLAGGGATAQSGAINTTITGNTIANPGNDKGTEAISKNGIHLNIGTVVGDTFAACAKIGGDGTLGNEKNNIVAAGKDGIPPTGVGDIDFRLRQRQSTTVRLPGFGGGDPIPFVQGNNNIGGTPTGLSSGTFSGGAACTLPSGPTIEEAGAGSPIGSQIIESTSDKNAEAVIASDTSNSSNEVMQKEVSIHAPESHSFYRRPEWLARYVGLRINDTGNPQPSAPPASNRDLKFAVYKSDDAGIPNLRPASHVVTAAAQNRSAGRSVNTPQAGETVQITAPFTLPANKSVTIKFQVTIPDPAGVTQISTRGTVSGTNFTSVQTTDPGPPAVNGATVTPIDLVDTTTTLMSSDTTTAAGEAVTFTATVARTNPGAGTITGTVQFKDGAANLGSPVTIASGQAQLTTSCLTTGNHSITAVYNGDTNFKTSTSTPAVTQMVSAPTPVFVDDSFAGSTNCQDLGGGKVFGLNAFATIAAGQAGVAAAGTVNVAEGTYAESVTVATGTLTLSGNVQITGNLTLSGGTFNSTSGVLSITGNFTHSGGTFNTNSGTVAMTGSTAQTLGGTVQTAFNILEINNGMGVSLGVDKSVATTLKMTNGNLNAATFTLSLGASTTIMRTSGHVLGNLKKNFSGTGSFTYHVGTANGYSPVTVNVTAGTGDLTVKAVQGPQPTLNAMKSLQRYWTLAGTGITVNMTFSYIDPTDIMGNEAAYRVIRVDGATAVIYDDSPPVSFVDEAANTINVQNISGFSDWTAGEATAPTAVEDVTLEATGYDGGTFIHWRTGSEVANVGFNLYRQEGGSRVLVNPQVIAGSALAAGSTTALGAGKSYGWWDAQSNGAAQYWVEDIDLGGQTRLHGPFSAKQVGGAPPDRTQAALLSKVGNRQSGITQPVAISAPIATDAAQRGPAAALLAGQAAVKLAVRREGFYRVTAADLTAAGLDPRVDAARLQLYVDGRQLPINVKTDNAGLLAAVEFYGVGLDTASTDARVYWLIAGQQPGLRFEQVGGEGRPSAGGSFLYTAERKDRTVYFSALRNGERENFFGAVVANEPVDQSIMLRHVEATAQGQATVEVALQGVSNLQHSVWAYVNGNFAGELSFSGQSSAVARFAVANSLLREGENQIRLVAQGGPSDISLLDYIRVSYFHSFTADDDALRFTAAGGQSVTVGGFSNASIRVFDVTDADSVQEVRARVEPQKEGGYAVTVAAAGAGERKLLAIADGRAVRPARVAANTPSSLRTTNHAADLVIITRRDFFLAFDALARHRAAQGIKVELVDIEDIYDEFSYGHKSPQSVKEFLLFAKTSWKTAPRYVLFGADMSYDPKDYLGIGDWDIAPARLVDTGLMETASDDWFADFNGDGLAEMSVGRLPVRTAAEAAAIVAKIIGYEQGGSSEEMLLVADSNDTFSFEGANAQLRGLIPANLRVNEISRGRVDIATARAQLIEAALRGQKIINYTGHGSVDQWRGGLLTNGDAAALGDSERASVYVMMTCLNSYGLDPALDSLAEALLKTGRGGAVAVWASSGMTNPEAQAEMNRELYRLVFGAGGGLRLGELTGRAKAAVTDADVRVTWMLIGDPAMRIR